jgi:hypothetical protein
MVIFGIAPPLVALLLQPILIHLYSSGSPMRMPFSYFLSVLYGALFGLAACFSAAPATAQQQLRPGPPAAISAIIIVAGLLVSTFLRFQLVIYALTEMAVVVAILSIARSILVTEAPPEPNAEPPALPVQRKLWPALLIGFFPAAMILAAIPIGSTMSLGAEAVKALLALGCVVSTVCCFTASIMLFKRHTGGAIAGGILLMLLNAFIAFFFGCCVAISNTGFH